MFRFCSQFKFHSCITSLQSEFLLKTWIYIFADCYLRSSCINDPSLQIFYVLDEWAQLANCKSSTTIQGCTIMKRPYCSWLRIIKIIIILLILLLLEIFATLEIARDISLVFIYWISLFICYLGIVFNI